MDSYVNEVARDIADDLAGDDDVMAFDPMMIAAIIAIIMQAIEMFDNCQPAEGTEKAIVRLSRGRTRGGLIARWRLSRLIRNEFEDADRTLRNQIRDAILEVGADSEKVKKLVEEAQL